MNDMSLEGKYMIAFTKGMDVEEYEGPGGPGHHGPPKDAKPFFMTYAGTIAEDGTVEGTMTCTGRYEHPTVDKMTGHRL